jgi:hypothetical protein
LLRSNRNFLIAILIAPAGVWIERHMVIFGDILCIGAVWIVGILTFSNVFNVI